MRRTGRAVRVGRTLCITLLLLAFPAISWAALAAPATVRLEATASRSDAAAGAPIELRLRTSADTGATPDLSPLERDFEIVGVSEMVRTTIVNGLHDQAREWRVQLLPLRDDVSEIPSISLGGAPATASAPLAIEHGGRARSAPTADPTIAVSGPPATFVEASVDEDSPYVQGQVVLRVKILSTEPIVSGAISDVQVADASIEQVGEDRSYQTTRDGRDYRVFERSFAIFPQRSGELQIDPVVFEGLVRDDGARGPSNRRSPSRFGGSLFAELEAMMTDDFFGPRGRPVRARSEALLLDVRPRPADAGGRWWLPAEELKLSEEWDPAPETLVVGEQVTRSLIVQALGASRDQIPEIDLPEVAGLKQYREPAVEETLHTEQGLAALAVQKTVLIPTEPGDYVLPEVGLEWWDTSADRLRVATLPERRIRVVAAATDPQDPIAQVGPASGEGPPTSTPEQDAIAQAEEPIGGLWRWVVGATIAGAGSLVALFRFVGVRPRRAHNPSPDRNGPDRVAEESTVHSRGLRSAERRLKRACLADDAEAAIRALRDIAGIRGSDAPALALEGFADRLGDPALRIAVDRLQHARFASAAEAWDGALLWQAYRPSARSASSQQEEHPGPVLPNLYPNPIA